jgi:hypothetical protein
VSKKVYFAGLFALVLLVSVFALGIAAARDYGIMGPGISVYITSPNNSGAYTYHVSSFSWSIDPWTSLASCWYTLNGGAENFVNCDDNFSNFASPLADGSYTLHFVANKTITQIWDDTITFLIDTTPPLYSNIHAVPASGVAYVPGQDYDFYVDWDGTESSVWYELDGVVNTDVLSGGGSYYFHRSDLPAGTYNYRWYANDSLGNTNQTDLISYVVNKADPTAGMSITGTTPIVYGTTSDFDKVETNVGDGGCVYDLSPSNAVFGGGITTFTYSTIGCTNYSAGSITKNLTVNPASTTTTASASVVSPIVYENLVSFSCVNSASLVTQLYIDGVDRTSDAGVNLLLGAGTYNVTCFGIANQNYSGSSDSLSFVVNRAPQNAVLALSPSSSIVYGTNVSISCNGTLFRNDVDVTSEIGTNVLLGAGSYNYSCKLFENANYTFDEMNETLTVGKADPANSAHLNPALTIEISPGTSVYVGSETNVTAFNCPSALTCVLFRNDTEVNNSDIQTLGLGTYNYTYNTTGNENYSASQISAILNVISAPSGGGGGGGHVKGSWASCYSNWTCTSWSECGTSGTQARVCSLVYDSAGGLNNTPVEETRTTSLTEKPVSQKSGSAGITGGVIGALTPGSLGVILLFVALIGGAYGIVVWRKRRFHTALERTLWQAASTSKK